VKCESKYPEEIVECVAAIVLGLILEPTQATIQCVDGGGGSFLRVRGGMKSDHGMKLLFISSAMLNSTCS
jgi:hypothetical protein